MRCAWHRIASHLGRKRRHHDAMKFNVFPSSVKNRQTNNTVGRCVLPDPEHCPEAIPAQTIERSRRLNCIETQSVSCPPKIQPPPSPVPSWPARPSKSPPRNFKNVRNKVIWSVEEFSQYVCVRFIHAASRLVWMLHNGRLIQLILVRLVDIEHMYLVVIHVKWEASDPMRVSLLAFHRMQFFVPLLEESWCKRSTKVSCC